MKLNDAGGLMEEKRRRVLMMRRKAADNTRSKVSTAPAGADEPRRIAWTYWSWRALSESKKDR